MAVEEKCQQRRNKYLYKIELCIIKYIPLVLMLVCFINTTLSYFNIDCTILSYIGGISILPLLFLYVSSFVFQFCIFHRLPLYYIGINMILNLIDEYIGIPVSNKSMYSIYLMITVIFIIFLIYEHQKTIRNTSKRIGR